MKTLDAEMKIGFRFRCECGQRWRRRLSTIEAINSYCPVCWPLRYPAMVTAEQGVRL